ncbi:hypothetical protein SSTU70S_06655 [Stutzerimonas stutzeri]
MGDLGVLHRQVEGQEQLPDSGKQAGAIRCDDLDDRLRALGIVVDRDLRREGEVLELARHVALDDGEVLVGIARCVDQTLANFLDPLAIVADRRAVGVQHDVGVERELAARSDDAGIVDG